MIQPKANTEHAGGLSLAPLRPPLRLDEGNVVRVGEGRVSLDVLVEQFENGMTPEDLARAYDTLELADVYVAIGYYLRHQSDVRAYLKSRQREADSLQQEVEAERPRISREDLRTRRDSAEKADAPSGQ